MSGQESVDDSLTYSVAPGYLEPLMAEGRIGDKLHLLGLAPFMKPAIFLKVGTPRVQEWWRTGDRGRKDVKVLSGIGIDADTGGIDSEAIHEHNQQARPHPNTTQCTLNLFVPWYSLF